MQIQFLYCKNPNSPEQGEFIYHAKVPRFLAKIEGNELVIIDKIDGESIDYSGKLSRAKKWLISFKGKNDY